MTQAGDAPTVLVADDDVDFADTVGIWLRDEHRVRTAYSGDEALNQYDEDVDVVLLDRWLSNWDGDDLLTKFHERSGQCCIALVTAAEPDLDLLDLSFEEYLMKPVGKQEVTDTVQRLRHLADADAAVREYYRAWTTLRVLESPQRAPNVGNNRLLDDLRERVTDKRQQVDSSLLEEMDIRFNPVDSGASLSIEETTD